MPREFYLDTIKFDAPLFLNFARFFSPYDGTMVLYSGGAFDTAKVSYLGLFPFDVIFIGDQKLQRERKGLDYQLKMDIEDPWKGLEAVLPDQYGESAFPEWMGFMSYELGMYSDAKKTIKHKPLKSVPHAYFQRCSIVLAFDHIQQRASVRIMDAGLYLLDEDEKSWVQRLSEVEKWEDLARHLAVLEENSVKASPLSLAQPREKYESYQAKVEAAKELIRAGDIYQVNLSQQFVFEGKRDPFQIFDSLSRLNPSPFSAYLKLKHFAVVSSSPERFLCKREGWLETRPIKGTKVRGKTPQEDASHLQELMSSEKNMSELLMITDLVRNDLGKVSLPGSVSTLKMHSVASYENVHHLYSIVKSRALPGLHSVDILRSCFPGGSITGCPKLSAMEVIANLENRSRGLYTGSMGYFAANGDFDFNIAIRTLTVTDNHIDVQLGGAIIADSEAQDEYDETLHKGASIFKALQVEDLIAAEVLHEHCLL